MIYSNFLDNLGNTPLVKLELKTSSDIDLHVKLEGYNPTGSVKDRAANYILKKALSTGEINKDTLIIESSSGNFGISLASYCKKLGLKFCCVIDKNITPINETILTNLTPNIIKISKIDESGGYLMNRIKKVKEIIDGDTNSYWINQYSNPYNAQAYYESLGNELCTDLEKIDYIFLGVSSGGTITGISQRIKKSFPNAKVIAVDTEGSIIFGGNLKKRYLPGIGSSIVPSILKDSQIDEVVMVPEKSAIETCRRLLKDYGLFVGGSSGSVISSIEKYFKDKTFKKSPTVVAIFADNGERYLTTIFNNNWCKENFELSL